MPRRAVLFANGEMPQAALILSHSKKDDFLIAVDGGLRYVRNLQKTPDMLVGDLDSASYAEIEGVRAEGVEIRQYKVDKDETDLELGLLAAVEKGFDEIVVIAALGGRLDQTLANLYLLLLPELETVKVTIENGVEEVFLIRGSAKIIGNPGDIISLIPINGMVPGVFTTALKYPLNKETLYPGKTRGISNVMLTNQAEVSIDSGCLLCIHTRTQNNRTIHVRSEE